MKYHMAAIVMPLSVGLSAKEYSERKISRVYVAETGIGMVGFQTRPHQTCDSWGEHMSFDATTEAGKAIFSVLLAAKMADKTVSIWYTASSRPGTNQDNGCYGDAISRLTAAGIR